jgi:hypothetical protein
MSSTSDTRMKAYPPEPDPTGVNFGGATCPAKPFGRYSLHRKGTGSSLTGFSSARLRGPSVTDHVPKHLDQLSPYIRPSFFEVDHGREWRSAELEQLMATNGVELIIRSPARHRLLTAQSKISASEMEQQKRHRNI